MNITPFWKARMILITFKGKTKLFNFLKDRVNTVHGYGSCLYKKTGRHSYWTEYEDRKNEILLHW